MADITLPDIAEAVVKEIPNFFNDSIDQIRAGEGAYLRDGEPQGTVARIGQAVGRAACRQFGANPVGATLFNSERFERACRPYLESLAPGNGLGLALPFTGGQCAGVNYRANGQALYTLTNCSSGEPFPNQPATIVTEYIFPGPIVSVTPEYAGSVSCGQNIFAFRIVFDGGAQNTTFGQVINPVNALSNARFVGTFEPAAGGANDCGFPPPTVVQPRPQPDPTPPPFRFNPIPGVDLGIDVTINPDGTINFDLGDGPRTVDPFAEDEGGGGSGDPGDPTDPGTPGGGGDTGAGGDTEGEAPPGEELVGVLVQILSAPQDANTFDNNSATVYRGVGYVRMGYPNRLGVDITGGTVISPQFFHAQQRGLTSWAVRANLGFNIRATPYYRTLEP